MDKNRAIPRLVIGLLVLTGGVPARAADPVANSREKNRQQIANMSATERARLKRNFDKFRALSADEQARLRRLDEALKADRREQGGLSQTMGAYVEWLGTLQPGEREDLRHETSPDRRVKLVADLVKEQQQRQSFDPTGARLANRRRGLSPEDLDSVLAVLELAVRERHLLSPQKAAELEAKQGLHRHVGIVETILPGADRDGRPQPPLLWPIPDDVIEAMTAAISDSEHRRLIERGIGTDRSSFARGRRLFQFVYGGIWAEFEQLKPDEAELDRFFAELKAPQQGEIMSLPIERQERQLLQLYIEAHPDKYPRPPRFFMPFGSPGFQGRREGQPRPAEGPQNQRPETGPRGEKQNLENPPPARPGRGGRNRNKAGGEPLG
jgi:hypothetical protein